MSVRRSTRVSQRLAARNSTPSLERPGSSDSGFIVSENGSLSSTPRSISLQATTPTTTSSRGTRPRGGKRGEWTGGGGDFALTPLMEADMNNLVNSSPFEFETPQQRVSIQRKSTSRRIPRNVVVTPQEQVTPAAPLLAPTLETSETPSSAKPNELSLVNDSFLFAVDQLEEKAEKDEKEQLLVDKKRNSSVTWGSASPDMFGDDDDLLDIMPASQMEIEPSEKTPHRPYLVANRTSSKKRKKSLTKLLAPPPEAQPPRPKRQAAATTGDPPAAGRNKKKGSKKTDSKSKQKFRVPFTNKKVGRALAKKGQGELATSQLSNLSEEDKLKLTSWGLPASVISKYKSKGVTSLFPWQLECLGNEKVLEGRNLLYSAPTSAGKTLVAEILMVKRVLELGKKALMILPFVSVCREKMFSLQEIFGDAGVRVEGFMGAYCPPGGFKSVDIAICTIEKANSLINRLLEEDSLSQLGTIVVDELHLIGDPHRGYLLELLLTKIKYMTSKQMNDSLESEPDGDLLQSKKLNIQIIGMSATLPNLELLSSWLEAELVVTNYRPVPLVERIVINGRIYDELLHPVRDVRIDSLPIDITEDEDHLAYLSLETILEGHSILIFCPTKQKCERVAQKIAREIWDLGSVGNHAYPELRDKLRERFNPIQIKEVLSQLKQCPGGLEEVLDKTISFGVAYHHAGLTYDERDIIESSFKRGVIRVIVATSTLSAGVNLPARRVIISTPLFNGNTLDVLTYRQMCGRAGRKGVDTQGESILICPLSSKEKGVHLVQSALPRVKSALLGDEGCLTSSMKRALLEVIASEIATLPEEVEKYAKCTLLSKSIDSGLYDNEELPCSQQNKDDTIRVCLKFLEENDFIRLQKFEKDSNKYMATQLGCACLASSLAPDEGITVYKELLKARKRFVLDSDLHVVYQVTPIYLSDQMRSIQWLEYLSKWNDLSPEDKEVANLVGIEEHFLVRAMMGTASARNIKYKQSFMIHQRFYAALALNDLVNEMPIGQVADKYGLNKGVIQNLQQAASTFAGMVTAFCSRLGWSNLELLLSQFQERLQFGVQRELCDLVRLSTMNGQRARILYDNGIKTISDLASSDPAQVENILHRAIPFQSAVHGGQGEQLRSIWVLGNKDGLSESEAAQVIVEEARQFIKMELGLAQNIQFVPLRKYDTLLGSQNQRSLINNSKVDVLRESESSSSSNEEEDEEIHLKVEVEQAKEYEEEVRKEEVDSNNHSQKLLLVTSHEDKPKIEEEFTKSNQLNTIEKELIGVGGGAHLPVSTGNEELFEDSFPVINSEDLFGGEDEKLVDVKEQKALAALNSQDMFGGDDDEILVDMKKGEERDAPPLATGAGEEEAMELDLSSSDMKALLLQMVESSMETSQHEKQVTPKSFNQENNRLEGKESIRHSTPVIHAYVTDFKKRLSAILTPDFEMEDGKSPGQRIKKTPNLPNPISSCDELNEQLLAEFDKDFDSVASLMEVSLNISGGGGEDSKTDSKMKAENKKETNVAEVKIQPFIPKLSDSDAAAMQAIADDSKPFDSEDLFADEIEKCEKDGAFEDFSALVPPALEQDQDAESSSRHCDTNGSTTDLFETSSEVESTRTSSVLTSGQSSARNYSHTNHHESILLANLGQDREGIKVRKVFAPEFIPQDMFDPLKPVGIGLKLAPPSKRPISIARSGIGSRIIGKRGGGGSRDEDREHSIALYNGGNCIWLFQWKHVQEEDGNGGRIMQHPSLNIEGKLGELFGRFKKAGCSIILFDLKEKLKKLFKYFGNELIKKLPPSERMWDPKIGQWMLQFDEENWNVSVDKLAELHLEDWERKMMTFGWDREIIHSYLASGIMKRLKEKLEESKLWQNFIGTEMPSVMPLMLMEINGFGLDSQELSRVKRILQFKSALLEIKAFQLAGRQFNLSSPKEIRQILFREIGLKEPTKSKGTGKDVLSKLDHELPQVIIEWRKITSALQKVVIPFQQEKNLETSRLHGVYSHFTVTGRVTMSEPSLQCIPRDFDLMVDFSPQDVEEIKSNFKIKFGSKLSSLLKQIELLGVTLSQQAQLAGLNLISMRNVFVPSSTDFILLSADYSQLELRILAHLSQDGGLLKALNEEGGDVFISIASQWKKLPPEKITKGMRQETKGIVYGVIYGMGVKTLSEQMEVDEADAAKFIAQFMRTYPGVRNFLDKAVKTCRKNGFIETVSGRRRYLPNINSKNPTHRAQAERQALNSQIQGSAADLVKTAMTKIFSRFLELFPESIVPIKWNTLTKKPPPTTSSSASNLIMCPKTLSKVVVFPVLNLHDELIFEVRKSHVEQVARELKEQMESSLTLTVKLPVVLKTGTSWATLSPLE